MHCLFQHTYNDVNDGVNSGELTGGVTVLVSSSEVLTVVFICGDDRQSGILWK